tara:strand:+ start:717 stop:866 length:150 start_codon:yes stop_codon:yes gene_type:complete
MSSRAPEIFVEDRLEEKEGAELTKEMVTKCYDEYCRVGLADGRQQVLPC